MNEAASGAALLALLVAACGIKGPPRPPRTAPSAPVPRVGPAVSSTTAAVPVVKPEPVR